MKNIDMDGSVARSFSLFLLRIFIGWHLLFEGLIKVMDPSWTAHGFLKGSKWIFSDFFLMIANNSALLGIVDLLNQWGLVLIGLALFIGVFTRIAAISGVVLLMLYYVCMPPFMGLDYASTTEGSYMIVNKNLIEVAALLILSLFSAGEHFGLDLLRRRRTGKLAF
ncbi:MAG: DoxX family protein [Cyclobacteriaceae bacterium]|nr:DoxX family protein [Cyclobacteriaceae bacterium SS2]